MKNHTKVNRKSSKPKVLGLPKGYISEGDRARQKARNAVENSNRFLKKKLRKGK